MIIELTYAREDSYGAKYFKFFHHKDMLDLMHLADKMVPNGKHSWMSEYKGVVTLKSKYKGFAAKGLQNYNVKLHDWDYNGQKGTWVELELLDEEDFMTDANNQ
jgi:hypothetical protein